MDINPQLSDLAAEMITDERITAAIKQETNTHPPFEVLDMELPQPPPEVGPPVILYSFGLDAEELICVYGAMRTYLKALASQDSEDLEMIRRTAAVMIQMKPRAVEASKSLALKAVGMEAKHG